MFPGQNLNRSSGVLESHHQRSEHGPTAIKSEASSCQAENTYTTWATCLINAPDLLRPQDNNQIQIKLETHPPTLEHVSSTPESQAKNKRKRVTSSVKSTISSKRARTQSSSRTLRRGSTTNARVCRRFWNVFSQEWSEKLWLPTETDSLVSGWSSWSGCSKSMTASSWFSTKIQQGTRNHGNSQTTCLRSAIFLLPRTTANGQPEEENSEETQPPIRSKLLALKTTCKQRNMFMGWIHTARCIWNICVDMLDLGIVTSRGSALKQELRAMVSKNNSTFVQENQWMLLTPADIRDDVVIRFVTAYTTSLNKHGEGCFRMKHKSRKETQSFYLKHRGFSNGKNYKKLWGRVGPLETWEPRHWDCNSLGHDTRVVFQRPRKWFIAQSVQRDLLDDNQVPRRPVVALDPGERTFQTAFDPLGAIIEFGPAESKDRLFSYCKQADKLIDTALTTKHRRTRRRLLRNRVPRLETKIKNRVKDLHCKTASWLCRNYECVLLPTFQTHQMAKRTANRDDGTTRKLNNKTARMLLQWSHYKFKQRLINKGEETRCKVLIVDEAYTTKTCTKCGHVRSPFGGKTFKCESVACGYQIDRDWNGGRNILLRTLSKQ